MLRFIAYIDGFNLYFGLKSQSWERFLWLDVQALSRNLLQPGQSLAHTKYFTSRVTRPPDKAKRQSTYIDAVQTLADTSIYFGKYQTSPHTCRNCGYVHNANSEKMTDVNIAVELLQDAFQDAFDAAILISADSDLVAPIEAVKRLFPSKRVIVACPPGRFSQSLCKAAHAYLKIGHGSIEKSRFPEGVETPSGFVLLRPASWK
jgi:uncharacterized LabA/DUF88 family protein